MKLKDLNEAGEHYQPKTSDKGELKARLADLQKELAEMKRMNKDEIEPETIPDIQAEIASVKKQM